MTQSPTIKLTNPGDTITEDFGPAPHHTTISVKTTLQTDGVSFYVADLAGRVDELSKSFTDRAQAAAFYRHVKGAAEQGKRVYQIVWEIQALEEAQNASTPDEVAAEINAEWDARHAQTVQTHNALVADVQAIVGDGQGWRIARANAYTTARANTRPLFHGKRAEPSDLQQRALDLRTSAGEIRVQAGVNARTLQSMARKGFGRLILRGGSYRPYEVVKLVLHPHILAELNEQLAA